MKTFPRTCALKWKGFWARIADWALCLFFRKGVKNVDVIYATLIVKSLKTYSEVPAPLKEKVKEILIALGLPELAE